MSNIKSLDALNKYVSGNLGKNLLINGDFSVNQRGATDWASVTEGAYGWDRWKKSGSNIIQPVEDGAYKPDATHTLSGDGVATQQITSPASGAWNITVANTSTWTQLELGDTATDFEVVDPGTQLARCRRYFNKVDTGIGFFNNALLNSTGVITTTGYIFYDFPVRMRDVPSPVYTVLNGTDEGPNVSTDMINIQVTPTSPNSARLTLLELEAEL